MPPEPAPRLFEAVADQYAAYRPTYPERFFEAFAERCSGHGLVWDCGCGNGQASLALARHFEQVVATDASAAQLAQADPHPRVRYQRAEATASGLDDHSVDAVLVAQAVHWFAGDAFNAEVRRVARPGAVMAWIGYLPLQLDASGPNAAVQRFYAETLAPWWPPQRRLVEQSLAGLPFPGDEWPFPQTLWIERPWNLEALLGYINSWSAVEAARQAGSDPVIDLAAELRASWPDAGMGSVRVRWRFMGRWGAIRHSP